MVASLRFYGLSLLLVSGLLGVALERPRWLETAGFEVASVPLAGEPAGGNLAAQADPNCAISRARVDARRRVIAQLLAGEMSLFEAAAWFRDLNAEPPSHPDEFYQLLPGNSDEEKLCRQVILWVGNRGADDAPPSKVGLVTARLEAQLAAQLRRGRIDLPKGR